MSYFAIKTVSWNGRISFDIIGNKMYDDGFTQVGFGEHNFILLVGLDQSVQSKTMNYECKQQQLAVSCSVVSIIMKNTII